MNESTEVQLLENPLAVNEGDRSAIVGELAGFLLKVFIGCFCAYAIAVVWLSY